MPLVTIASSFADALKKEGVFSDVLDPFEQRAVLSIAYGKQEVSMGNTLSVAETQELPKVGLTFLDSVPDASYTLVVTDPDAPRRGDLKWSEYAHYVASGIRPGVKEGEPTTLDLSKATELLPYQGPAPPEKTGKHRYVTILYKEGSSKPEAPSDRPNWGTGQPGAGARQWASKHGLTPVAVNFFYAQNETQ